MRKIGTGCDAIFLNGWDCAAVSFRAAIMATPARQEAFTKPAIAIVDGARHARIRKHFVHCGEPSYLCG